MKLIAITTTFCLIAFKLSPSSEVANAWVAQAETIQGVTAK